jgi:hypothetical protein
MDLGGYFSPQPWESIMRTIEWSIAEPDERIFGLDLVHLGLEVRFHVRELWLCSYVIG